MYKEAKNSETDKRRKMLQEDINKLVRKKILSIDSNGVFHLSLDVPITRKIKNDILLRTIMILMRYKEKYNNCIFSAAKPKSRVKPTFLACAENVNQRFPIKNNFAPQNAF